VRGQSVTNCLQKKILIVEWWDEGCRFGVRRKISGLQNPRDIYGYLMH